MKQHILTPASDGIVACLMQIQQDGLRIMTIVPRYGWMMQEMIAIGYIVIAEDPTPASLSVDDILKLKE